FFAGAFLAAFFAGAFLAAFFAGAFLAAFFAGAFLAAFFACAFLAAFFAGAFLAAFFACAFLAAFLAGAFLCAAFLAGAFLCAAFLAGAFFAAIFFAGAFLAAFFAVAITFLLDQVDMEPADSNGDGQLFTVRDYPGGAPGTVNRVAGRQRSWSLLCVLRILISSCRGNLPPRAKSHAAGRRHALGRGKRQCPGIVLCPASV